MQNVKKMALVPHQLVEKLMEAQREQRQLMSNTSEVQLSSLDQQLNSILNSNIHAEDKAKQYDQTFRYYTALRDKEVRQNYEKPEPNIEKSSPWLSDLPKPYINKGKMLVSNILQNKDLTWNDKNEIFYKGDRIEGSNIIDLIHTFVKPSSSKSQNPTGWSEFRNALRDSNVPLTAIANKKLWEEAERFSTPIKSSKSADISYSPTEEKASSRKVKRQRKPKQQWTPYK